MCIVQPSFVDILPLGDGNVTGQASSLTNSVPLHLHLNTSIRCLAIYPISHPGLAQLRFFEINLGGFLRERESVCVCVEEVVEEVDEEVETRRKKLKREKESGEDIINLILCSGKVCVLHQCWLCMFLSYSCYRGCDFPSALDKVPVLLLAFSFANVRLRWK